LLQSRVGGDRVDRVRTGGRLKDWKVGRLGERRIGSGWA